MDEKEVIEGIVKGFTDSLIGEAKTIFKDFTDEAKQFINNGLKEYLEKQRNKYSQIKTLLRGNTPVNLYDIYYPLKLECQNKAISTDQISNIFKNSNYVTIIGDAGSGKSTLAKHLFLNAIQEKYAIPLLIELRYLNDFAGELEEFISDKIFENKLTPNSEILQRLLVKGKFVFFLDGYDELISSVRIKIIKNLNSFINKYHKNKFILTTRPYSNIELLPLFHNMKVMELTTNDVNAFIDKQLPGENELARRIKESISENKGTYIHSFLKNPLLLSIYILTYQSNAKIPTKKYIFYRRVIQVLFSEHDSRSKLGYTREFHSNLTQEQFEEILKRFCFLTYFENKFNFELDYTKAKLVDIKDKIKKIKFDSDDFIYDMKLSVALWVDDNGLLSFAHRSLQEYFTAAFIKGLGEENKKIIYDKIKNKSSANRFGEIENLISLCDEMDHRSYLKLYYIPVLTEFKNYLSAETKLKSIKKFLKLIGSAAVFKNVKTSEDNIDSTSIIFTLSADLFRFIYVTDTKLRELFMLCRNSVMQYLKQDSMEVKLILKKLFDKEMRFELATNYSKIFKGARKKELHKLFNSTIEYINKEIDEAEETIKTLNQSDKDLIALI